MVFRLSKATSLIMSVATQGKNRFLLHKNFLDLIIKKKKNMI